MVKKGRESKDEGGNTMKSNFIKTLKENSPTIAKAFDESDWTIPPLENALAFRRGTFFDANEGGHYTRLLQEVVGNLSEEDLQRLVNWIFTPENVDPVKLIPLLIGFYEVSASDHIGEYLTEEPRETIQ
jgi:hypothetical protein